MKSSNSGLSNAATADNSKEFHTVSQVAKLLQLTEMTIYRMVNRGDLPCYCIGRVKRFRRDDIERFLKACRVPATQTGWLIHKAG